MTFWSDLMDSVAGKSEPPPDPPTRLATQFPSADGTPNPSWMTAMAATEALLRLREGEKLVVYLDTRKIPTVGIGHKVLSSDHLKVGDTISQAQVDAFFAKDIGSALAAAHLQAEQAGITAPAFIPYLTSVCYQLGVRWTTVFPNTWKQIVAGDYEEAALSVGTSTWAKQTPVRVTDFQGALRRLPVKPV